MANNDNKLKDLEIEDLVSKSKDTLGDCYNHQKYMQEDVYGYNYKEMTIGEIVDFCLMNKHALEDEMGEFMDALGGISDGTGNAAWKPWKSANKSTRSMKISDLSQGDLKELKMEFIDMFHFFMNFGIAIGITSDEVFNFYYAKALENKKRQENNY